MEGSPKAYVKDDNKVVDVINVDYSNRTIMYISKEHHTNTESFDAIVLFNDTGRTHNGLNVYEGQLFHIEDNWDMYAVVRQNGIYGLEGIEGTPFISFDDIDRQNYSIRTIPGFNHKLVEKYR